MNNNLIYNISDSTSRCGGFRYPFFVGCGVFELYNIVALGSSNILSLSDDHLVEREEDYKVEMYIPGE